MLCLLGNPLINRALIPIRRCRNFTSRVRNLAISQAHAHSGALQMIKATIEKTRLIPIMKQRVGDLSAYTPGDG